MEGCVDSALPGGDPSPAAATVLPHEEAGEETYIPELAAGPAIHGSLLAELISEVGSHSGSGSSSSGSSSSGSSSGSSSSSSGGGSSGGGGSGGGSSGSGSSGSLVLTRT
ncbi:hypothetical protein PAMP_008580 [Pampus punctatissimus]